MKNKLTAIVIILKTYLLSALIFFIFRLIFFYTHYQEVINDSQTEISNIFSSFYWGLRYDLVIIGYLSVIPYLFLILSDYQQSKIWQNLAFWYLFILMSFAFMITAGNIVYFNQFSEHITVYSLKWFENPEIVFGMVFQEPKYWFMFIPFFIVIFAYYKLLIHIFKVSNFTSNSKILTPFYYLLFFLLIFLSIRGRTNSHPLRNEDAYIHKNIFLNKMKLNPMFIFGKSFEIYLKDKSEKLQLIDDNKAIENVQKYLKINPLNTKYPLARKIEFDTIEQRKNVVLIFMESMASWKMKYFGNKENRTPFLDSIFLKGLSFSNMYSSGIHTYAGIYSTNFSYPVQFNKHPLKNVKTKIYNGLPQTLKKHNYITSFFIPHNAGFDNLGNFLRKNAYDSIYFDVDYPKDSIRNIWGVDDHFLFNFALNKIEKLHQSNKPFLATILTISDHGPYFAPNYIKGKNIEIRTTRFADWSIRDFMKKAEKKEWFNNTVFIFVADHGQTHNMIYEMPLSYNHIPVIFYYKGIKPQIVEKIAGQIDVFPTLMGILKMDYINNSQGIDLLNENRPYIFYNHDKLYGLIDHEFLLIMDNKHTKGLYKYRNKNRSNLMNQYPEKLYEMEEYIKSNLQITTYILDNNLQFFSSE